MLVLARKKNESIVIREDVVVTVVEVRGDKVRLGIEAPKEVKVHRREVYDAIRQSEQQSQPASDPPSEPGAE
ncbi:MAG: carbon storage regulator CsrA [Thermoguttaceae bacterium]|jgi:carbon storage regulator|nr:carbon storage regulator CsrA [Thermoguttaceae bacterium]